MKKQKVLQVVAAGTISLSAVLGTNVPVYALEQSDVVDENEPVTEVPETDQNAENDLNDEAQTSDESENNIEEQNNNSSEAQAEEGQEMSDSENSPEKKVREITEPEASSDTEVTLENTGGNNLVSLGLGSAKYFTFSATVAFNDYETGQRSAALAFGDYRANVHELVGDWGTPVRIFNDANPFSADVEGVRGSSNPWLANNGISLAQPFTLSVSVKEGNKVSYSVNGKLAITTTLPNDYEGGDIGVMTFGSSATFSNITLTTYEEDLDYTSLQKLVATCNTYTADSFTEESWAKFGQALDSASAMIANQSASSQDEINAAYDALNSALAGLKEKPSSSEKGTWTVNEDGSVTGTDDCQNNYNIAPEVHTGDWTMSADVKYTKGLVNLFYATGDTPNENSYTVQVGDNTNVRLFNFTKADDATGTLSAPINDGKYHSVSITKKRKTVTVTIDGAQVIKHTFETIGSNFNSGRVGFGLWDGEVTYKNLTVTTPEKTAYDELQELIEKAESVKLSDYSEKSSKALTEALEAAKKMEESAAADDINAAKDILAKAMDNLAYAVIDPNGFTNVGDTDMAIDGDAILLANSGGDHFAMLSSQETAANDFFYEADVQLLEGAPNENYAMSAGIVFGAESRKTPGAKWYCANIDTRRSSQTDFFRVFGAGSDIVGGGIINDVDINQPLHLAIDVKADGSFTYTFGNKGKEAHSVSGQIENWTGGFVGLLSFNTKAAFSNVSFVDRTVNNDGTKLDNSDEKWKTDLGDTTYKGGSWTTDKSGLISDATGKGDTFLLSKMTGTNFIYETDLSYESDSGAAGLLFRFSENADGKQGYAVNVDAGSHKAKFWRWQDNAALQLIDEKDVEPADTYHLKVIAIDGNMQYWVNGVLIANLGDHTLQKDDKGQSTVQAEGYYGLLNWNAKATFQNTNFTVLDDKNTPAVSDVTVGSHSGDVDKKAQFFPESATWIQYVKNNAETVYLKADKAEDTTVTFEKDGNTYQEGEDIPVSEGINWITMHVINGDAERTYSLDIHRFQKDNVYYNEPYRGQYHYSVKEGWANDPNGLVYYKGKYHMFYQFYDDTKWGPMHWMHAVSTDLIHWEEEPVALYPDVNGTMFSGCIVADETNQSRLFSTKEGGLIAFITVDGNGQRIKLAYSEDEGKTWKKVDQIAADWTNDPLQDAAFRDPKVFQWEGKWFMVVAGGPLRIYSSDNLVDWKCESTYKDLHTECPDLYPQEVDGQVKWILSRGGRYYKVGDLKQVNGKWTYVPDDYYKDKDGVMNFGPDSYAAMTYYVSSFGTSKNPTIPDLIELNWMNTWADGYCNQVADKVGQQFNGTFNLHLQLGLEKSGDHYVLTQTPIDGYQDLRDEGTTYSEKVGADNTLLDGFKGTSYEIVSTFKPEAGTKKVGFQVRVGNGEHTDIVYDVEAGKLTVDRSHSGISIAGNSGNVNSIDVEKNEDGTIDLHVFVDSSSVEVFAKGYTAAGAYQIFPNPTSRSAKVIVDGDPCQADITIYDLTSVWTKEKADKTISSPDATEQVLYTGKSRKLSAYVLPADSSQAIVWTSSDEKIATVKDGTVTAAAPGKAIITATAKEDPGVKLEFTFEVKDSTFNTNVNDWVMDGVWTQDENGLVNDNTGYNAYHISKDTFKGDWTLETDVTYEKGLINIFFATNSSPFTDCAYDVQLTNEGKLKLMRFAGAEEEPVTPSVKINDGQSHHYKIVKEGKTITVYVDGQENMRANIEPALTHTYETVDAHYNEGHVGVGVWDGKATFQNFNVAQKADVDKSALEAKIKEAEALKESDYTADSWKHLQETLKNAKAMLENEEATQDLVDAETDALDSAIGALKKPETTVDKTKLEAAIKEADALKESDYTADSWKAYEKALESANKVFADDKADQEAVDQAVKALNDAKSALKKPETTVDKTKLEAAIKEADALKESDYTADSWKAYADALKAAKAVLADKSVSQKEVNHALEVLTQKRAALVKKTDSGKKTVANNTAAVTGLSLWASAAGASLLAILGLKKRKK
ncbi:family 16 glycoside hydrolase [uncultured Dubosiella sp.]|uniref:family 16 glycoside hydrolase n=1 Tax=uncultured Dubosiella sp. TaxID=1937011 RepID=UPI00263B0D05|nr:family 16 glycoside hydrolase [uncultured Dubosiella sp.]